jgi:hypothetical protein
MPLTKRIKANQKFATQSCQWCHLTFNFGEDLALCDICGNAVHAACWDKKLGCATPQCPNGPPPETVPSRTFGGDEAAENIKCANCRALIPSTSTVCPRCERNPFTGEYEGPTERARYAMDALIYGIISLFFLGFILGFVAINRAKKARAIIASHPRYTGAGLATAGNVLGVVAIFLHVTLIAIRLIGLANS